MKKMKFGALVMAGAIVVSSVSSCTSSFQATSGATGAMIGSRVGEAIGFVSGRGHFRGHNAALGSLIGAGVGAALGVGIASHIEKQERQAYDRDEADHRHSAQRSDERVRNNSDYQTGGGYSGNDEFGGNSGYSANSNTAVLSISELSYMDADGDGYFSKGEVCEIEGFIKNNTNTVLNDVVIYLGTDNEKDFSKSPSLTTTLQPGQKIRYTGRICCKKARRGQAVNVNLNVMNGATKNVSERLMIGVR